MELNYENNYRYIRYADVLLMAAEANSLTGNDTKARNYLNQVRLRAFGNDSQASSASGAAHLLKKFWMREGLNLLVRVTDFLIL